MKLIDRTSESERCIAATCPGVYVDEKDYVIIGKQVDPNDYGLEGRVGDGEVLIRVPKRLIDNMKR